ncbi:MAG: leucine-rich repeat domain-containing protein, partial [Treponema sp.]
IGDWAFSNCTSLTTITIPNSVTEIGNRAFSYCTSLTTITIPNSITEIGEGTFYGCGSLTTITIPNSVTKIGDWAFENCTSLTSATILNTNIPPEEIEKAFESCYHLKRITIGDKTMSVKLRLFGGIKLRRLV